MAQKVIRNLIIVYLKYLFIFLVDIFLFAFQMFFPFQFSPSENSYPIIHVFGVVNSPRREITNQGLIMAVWTPV